MRTLPFLLMLAVSPSAFAGSGALAIKTMREPLPVKEVERSLILPKGWLQLDLSYDRHVGTGAWGADGSKLPFQNASWIYDTQRARLSYGLSPQIELYWELPFREGHLTNPTLGAPGHTTDIRDGGMYDPRIGMKYELIQRDPPAPLGSDDRPQPGKTSVALLVDYKGPAGKESPGTYIGGPLNVSGFVFTTGTPDLSLGISAKQQVGPIGLTGTVDYVHRFGGVVQYLVELDQLQFLGRIKPGDELKADAKVELQAGPFVPYGDLRFTARDTTRIGTTAPTPRPNKYLSDVVDSSGNALDLDAGLLVDVSRGVDIRAHVLLPLMGEDLQFFPIEDLQPTLGPTFGGSVQVRY